MKNFFLKIYRTEGFYKDRSYWFLVAACTIFALLRLPSVIEPNWYGDEGIYQVVGLALNEGRILYSQIWDNKPPLLYTIYAISQADLFFVKLFSLIAGFLSVVFFFLLSIKLFKNKKATYLATAFYAVLFGAPVLEGNIANAENFMLLPVVAAAYFIYSYVHDHKTMQLVIAGFLLSLAFLTKIVAVFDFVAFCVFLLTVPFFRGRAIIKNSVLFVGSFLFLFLISCFYFLIIGAFPDFISGVFLQNVSYVSDQFGAANPMVMMAIKTILLLFFSGIVIFYRQKLSKPVIFIYLWAIFGLYNAFFSDRPYTHYVLVLLPAFSLLVGLLVETKKTRLVTLFGILLISYFAYFHFKVYRKNISYYQNYLSYIANGKSIEKYQAFFDGNTPRDYKLANFITANVVDSENVFLLSDSAQIYALSKKLPPGKYIVAYHISYYPGAGSLTEEQVEKVRPRYIIQTTTGSIMRKVLSSYELRYIMDGARIYERKI